MGNMVVSYKQILLMIRTKVRWCYNRQASWQNVPVKELAGTGSWHNMRAVRKPLSAQQRRLKDLSGNVVFSHGRAATLAEHLEKRQWAWQYYSAVYLPTSYILVNSGSGDCCGGLPFPSPGGDPPRRLLYGGR